MNSSQRLFTSPPSLDEFDRLCSEVTHPETYPLAAAIEKNVPVYKASDFVPHDEDVIAKLQDEWYHILLSGPGVFILQGMYSIQPEYISALDQATNTYNRIIRHEKRASEDNKKEKSSSSSKGDHFGQGTNERLWNSFTKHALADPSSFSSYYSNPWLSAVCTAWLGPAYRITAQVNIVKPGGAAQTSHRDYHLGFQTAQQCAQYPRAAHVASQFLTLQGAIAHSDMSNLASGPTRFLPFSQRFEEGYLAYRRPEFQQFFQRRYVALPLRKGDGVFFNPAVFHAAGANELLHKTDEGTGYRRVANLLQVSSAFGKTMESIDSIRIIERCWDLLLDRKKMQKDTDCLIRAIADGYPFPTNLDHRPPAPDGMAPESEQQLLVRALEQPWTKERLVEQLRRMRREAADDFDISIPPE